jgi:hypothetical protein
MYLPSDAISSPDYCPYTGKLGQYGVLESSQMPNKEGNLPGNEIANITGL